MFNSKMVRFVVCLGILMSTTVSSLPSPILSILQGTHKVANSLDYSTDYNTGEPSWGPDTYQEAKEHLPDSHQSVAESSQDESDDSDEVYHAPKPETREYEPSFESYQQPHEHLQSGGSIASAVSEDDKDESECGQNSEKNVSTNSSSDSTESTAVESDEYESGCEEQLGGNEQPQNITAASNLAGPEDNKHELECENYQDGNGQPSTCSRSSDHDAAEGDDVKLGPEYYYDIGKRLYDLNASSNAASPDSDGNKRLGENLRLVPSYNEKNHIFMLKAINRTRETLKQLNSILDTFGFRPLTEEEQTNSQANVSISKTPDPTDQSLSSECSVRDSEIIEWENLVKAIVRRLEDVTRQFSEFLLYQQQ